MIIALKENISFQLGRFLSSLEIGSRCKYLFDYCTIVGTNKRRWFFENHSGWQQKTIHTNQLINEEIPQKHVYLSIVAL
jgi:hypothetical protein